MKFTFHSSPRKTSEIGFVPGRKSENPSMRRNVIKTIQVTKMQISNSLEVARGRGGYWRFYLMGTQTLQYQPPPSPQVPYTDWGVSAKSPTCTFINLGPYLPTFGNQKSGHFHHSCRAPKARAASVRAFSMGVREHAPRKMFEFSLSRIPENAPKFINIDKIST